MSNAQHAAADGLCYASPLRPKAFDEHEKIHNFDFIAMSGSTGTMIEDRGLAMHIAGDGMAIYPLSSGSEAGLILKLGLYLFAVTACYSVVSIRRKHRDVTLFIVYSVNSVIYAFCLFIVMLDSSIIGAAKLGDWLPLAANIIWILSFVIYGAFSLKKSPRPTPEDSMAEL